MEPTQKEEVQTVEYKPASARDNLWLTVKVILCGSAVILALWWMDKGR